MKATRHIRCGVSVLLLLAGGSLFAMSSPVFKERVKLVLVVDKLGIPLLKMSGGTRSTYFYERGTVDFVTGRVERVMLVTSQEAKERTAARELAEENHRKMVEAERKRLVEAGEAERARTMADKSFAERPPAERLQYWTQFAKQYPYTDVTAQLADAATAVKAAQKEGERLAEQILLKNRAAEIGVRFKELDADYAASLANWKRNEIDDERSKLKDELAAILARLHELGD